MQLLSKISNIQTASILIRLERQSPNPCLLMVLFWCLNLMFFYSSGDENVSWRSTVIWVVVLDRAGSFAVQVLCFSVLQFNLNLSKQEQVQRGALTVQTFTQKLWKPSGENFILVCWCSCLKEPIWALVGFFDLMF